MAFCRIKDLKNTPIYVRPQFSSGGGVVTLTMMVGIRANIGKPVDNITVQLLLPPSVVSSDLTANFGTILPNHGTKVLSSISKLDAIYLCIQTSHSGWCHSFFFLVSLGSYYPLKCLAFCSRSHLLFWPYVSPCLHLKVVCMMLVSKTKSVKISRVIFIR